MILLAILTVDQLMNRLEYNALNPYTGDNLVGYKTIIVIPENECNILAIIQVQLRLLASLASLQTCIIAKILHSYWGISYTYPTHSFLLQYDLQHI